MLLAQSYGSSPRSFPGDRSGFGAKSLDLTGAKSTSRNTHSTHSSGRIHYRRGRLSILEADFAFNRLTLLSKRRTCL